MKLTRMEKAMTRAALARTVTEADRELERQHSESEGRYEAAMVTKAENHAAIERVRNLLRDRGGLR